MKRISDERSLRIAAWLGIDGAARERAHTAQARSVSMHAARLDAALPPRCTALVTGPSGAGKSTLLRMLARRAGGSAVLVRPLTRRQERVRVASLCARTPLVAWAGLLARFGLAEAGVLLARAGELSAGERARLELALAAARCTTSPGRKPGDSGRCALMIPEDESGDVEPPVAGPCAPAQGPCHPATLIADEWCSLLDRATAASVAAGAARWAREGRHGARLICATAHDDLANTGVDLVLKLDATGGARWTVCGSNERVAG